MFRHIKPTYAAVMNEQNKPIHFPFLSSGIPWKRGRGGRRGRVGGAPSSRGGEAHLDAFVLLLLRVKRMRAGGKSDWKMGDGLCPVRGWSAGGKRVVTTGNL